MCKFFNIVIVNGGISLSKIHKLLWYVSLNLLLMPMKWLEFILYHKRIKEQAVLPPLFIIGHWRSGTTFLHQLLVRDNEKGYLNFYQALFPLFFLSTEKIVKPLLQKFADLFYLKVPYFNNIPFNLDFPCEEDTALLNMNARSSAYWAYVFPVNALSWFSATMFFSKNAGDSEVQWKKDYLYLLKKLSFRNNGKQLILKSPPNTSRIKQIISIFPDAKFIYLHRDFCETYYSHRELWNQNNKTFSLQEISKEQTDHIVLTTFRRMMAKFAEDKDAIPSANLYEVDYSELLKDPLAHIRNIYVSLNLSNYINSKDEFNNYLIGMKKYQPFHYEYDTSQCRQIKAIMMEGHLQSIACGEG